MIDVLSPLHRLIHFNSFINQVELNYENNIIIYPNKCKINMYT